MTHDQLGACIKLAERGYLPVAMPDDNETTPTPGLMLFAKADHRELLMLQPDGSTVDLLALHRAAEDLIRNWGKGRSLPAFVGDWRRLTVLANLLNSLPGDYGVVLPVAGKPQESK